MIISFSVANFRSFAAEQTLSMVASKRLAGSFRDHISKIPGSKEHALKTAVIYGANGAGKSNLFSAIQFFIEVMLKARPGKTGTNRVCFKFGDYDTQPSTFDLTFFVGKKTYRLGLTMDGEKIIEEWLLRVRGDKEEVVYERKTGVNGNVTVSAPNSEKYNKKMRAIVEVGGKMNQSFLSTIDDNIQSKDIPSDIDNVISYLKDGIKFISPDTFANALATVVSEFPSFRDFASNFLSAASTGVDALDVINVELSEEEAGRTVPKHLLADALTDASSANSISIFESDGSHEFVVDSKNSGKIIKRSIKATHKVLGTDFDLDMEDESDGTKRLLNLIPALFMLSQKDYVFVIDEIDRSMHPWLVYKFLEFFLAACSSGHKQLIVTTHESNLLDLDLLRRDEIWFAEKDSSSTTHLYSLAEFQIRTDLDVRKHYLQGRFGAIPFLGNLDQFIEHHRADASSEKESASE